MCLFWIIAITVFFVVEGADSARRHRGVPLTCECSTSQCLQQGTSLCTTQEGLCFAQYLDRGPGSSPFVRGCTYVKTPLLCENRKPSQVKSWPLLHCCNTDFCNGGALPTPPAGGDPMKNLDISRNNHSEGLAQFAEAEPETSSPPSLLTSVQKSPWRHIVSPVYVSVLVLGIVSLIVIGIVAATVIRRSNRFYAEHYGALAFQPGKVSRRHCDCDSEMDSMGSSQPYLHIVCSNSRET